MIPGMGRFDPGMINSGGFEIVIGISTYAERRDQMLAMYREHNIAPKGMHVTNKQQAVGPAELPEGGTLTLEQRQAIAAARADAGYTPMPIGARVEEVGLDLSENEAYLDGIVDAPNWGEIGHTMDLRLTPMTIVMTRELPCPDAATADRVNRAFWDQFDDEPENCIETVRAFADSWIKSASIALTLWPPREQDTMTTELKYMTPHRVERDALLEAHVRSASITPTELRDQGLTLRNWIATKLLAPIVEELDLKLYNAVKDLGHSLRNAGATTVEDILKTVTSAMRGQEPVSWIMDTEAQRRLGLTPGQVIADLPGSQAICESSGPFPAGFILCRAEDPGFHIELPEPVDVEIEPDNDDPRRLNVKVTYWNALDADTAYPGFGRIEIGDNDALQR